MKRTTIFIEESLESELKTLSRVEGRSVAALVREALTGYVRTRRKRKRPEPSFVAIGRSGHRDTAERHEEILFQALTPHGDRLTRKPRRGGRRRETA